MDVVGRFAIPVGLVRWRSNASCYSPFVKLTYEIGASGWASQVGDPSLPTEGDAESGRVLRPSDFSESKGVCEVALVGRALAEHTGAVRLRVGAWVRAAPRIALLGPVTLGGGQSFFTLEEHRAPFPTLPIELTLEGVGETFRSLIPAPAPTLALAFKGGGSLQRVPLVIDTVLVDPHRRRCTLLFRGFFTHPGDVDQVVTLVVDPLGRLEDTPANERNHWPRSVAIEEKARGRDEEEVTPPLGHQLSTISLAREPTPLLGQPKAAASSAEITSQMAALGSQLARGEHALETSKPQHRAAPTLASGRLPLHTVLPDEAQGAPRDPLPFGRTPARSGNPAATPPPLPPKAQRRYDSTQAIPASPMHRPTLPFASPSDPSSKPVASPPAEPSRPSRTRNDSAEGTQLINLAAIGAKQEALPFSGSGEAQKPAHPEPRETAPRKRPQHVPFERAAPDPERTEVALAGQPTSNDEDGELDQAPTIPPPPPARDVVLEDRPGVPPEPAAADIVQSSSTDDRDLGVPDTVPPATSAPDTVPPATAAPDTAPPDTASPDTASPDTAPPIDARVENRFDQNESTGVIQLPIRRRVLPFGEAVALPPPGSAPKDDTLTHASLESSPESVVPPTLPPPTMDTMPPPPGTVVSGGAPAWMLPSGGAPLPAPAFAARLRDVDLSIPVSAPPMAVEINAWRPRQVPLPAPLARVIDEVPTLTLDEYAALRAELWRGERPRRDILKARGLSELRWRAVERKWAAEIDAVSGDPAKLMPILSRLQSFAKEADPVT